MRKLAVLLTSGLLVLSGCGVPDDEAPQGTPPQSPAESPAATPPAEDAAVIEGSLAGEAMLEGGCAWLETDHGNYEVLWPQGYEIAFDPVRLIGPDGEVVAEEGDALAVTGQVAEDMMSICMVGTIYQAETVTAVP